MKFLNLFSLVLLFVWQVSAGKCTGGRRNVKKNIYEQSRAGFQFSTKIVSSCSYDSKSKALTINGVDQSSEIYVDKYYEKHASHSMRLVQAIILKNFAIGNLTIKTVAGISYYCQNTVNALIIDSCDFSLCESIEFIPRSLSNVKKLKIINCHHIDTFGNLLDSFNDTLEELVIEKCHFSTQFDIPANLKRKSLKCARLVQCSLNALILKNILTLFPESLHTLEFSQLYSNSNDSEYVIFGDLKYSYGVRTISVQLPEGITVEQIHDPFDSISAYDKIKNVKFKSPSSSDSSSTCEFIIQMLKRVSNLKYLSFENMKDIIDMLFNLLPKEKLELPNLKKIEIDTYNGSIDLLLWFIQTFKINELNIHNSTLEFYSSKLLDNFSNNTLRTLRINDVTTNDANLLMKCFNNMKNLQELYFFSTTDPISLFKDNSTIEKVTIGELNYAIFDFDVFIAALKQFNNLKCICVVYKTLERDQVISAFEKHFKYRSGELMITYEPSDAQREFE